MLGSRFLRTGFRGTFVMGCCFTDYRSFGLLCGDFKGKYPEGVIRQAAAGSSPRTERLLPGNSPLESIGNPSVTECPPG